MDIQDTGIGVGSGILVTIVTLLGVNKYVNKDVCAIYQKMHEEVIKDISVKIEKLDVKQDEILEKLNLLTGKIGRK